MKRIKGGQFMKINKQEITIILVLFTVFIGCSIAQKQNESSSIMRVESKPLIFYADLNGDGRDEKVTMINKYPKGGISSLNIIINDDKGKIIFNYILPSREYKDYFGEYYIQKVRYLSILKKNAYRDLVLIYAGATPPELYILYCQPRQYTEGHKMIEDEKYDVLDTGILLEEFQG